MVKYKLTDNPVLRGDFYQTPKKASNTVRIFISSTFTDMTEERNALMRTTFTELQTHFRAKGYDFEVVDMRWGVREEMVLDHMASQMCQEQIDQAQKISQGVCFIALVGDKYGSCPLPYSISVEHYKHFVDVLKTAKIKYDLLEKWYLLDENVRKLENDEPAIYVLVPLTDRFKYINSNDPTNAEERFQEKLQWEVEQNSLRTLLKKAATLCLQEGRFKNESEKHWYFTAVTEREISKGILQDELAASRALCFIRTFEHFKASDESAARYADITNGHIDPTSKTYLNNLKMKKIPEALPNQNIFRYTIPWHSKGVCVEEEELHKVYLEQLCHDLKHAVIELSDKRINSQSKRNELQQWDDHWNADLLHHAEFCRNRVATYVQRPELQALFIKAIINNHSPLKKENVSNLTNDKNSLQEEEQTNNVLDRHKKFENYEKLYLEDELEMNADKLKQISVSEKVNKEDKDLFDNFEDSRIINNINQEKQEFFKNTENSMLETINVQAYCHKPLIIYGFSGCGKTSFLSHVVYNFTNYFNHSVTACPNNINVPCSAETLITIVRYLGTSPLSCTLSDLLQSVITQLWLAFNCRPNDWQKLFASSFSSLVTYFEQFLWSLESYNGTLLIALDAVDQLNADYGSYNMNWLPMSLPENVHFIISMYECDETTNDSSAKCLANVRKIIPFPQCYINVTEMVLDSPREIDNFLKIRNFDEGQYLRTVFTEPQRRAVFNAFQQCPQAVYLKMLIDFSKDWKSFTDVENIKFGKNCQELIHQLFTKLEAQHGKTLIYALKYLAASRSGLTNTEMEDMLTLEDSVLQDIYVYHLPAEKTVIRLPPMLWRCIRQQLSEYFAEKEADGKTVVCWYHRQFWEKEKYQNSSNADVHRAMAEYFSGEWFNKPKPLILFKGKKAEYPDCTRNIPPMPNYFSTTEPNLRKLNELPYHLILSYQMEKSEDLLTDFDFLLCKLKSMGFKKVYDDFRLFFNTFSPSAFDRADLAYLKIVKEHTLATSAVVDDRKDIVEMKIVLEILVNAFDALTSYWANLASQIIGCLSDDDLFEYPRVQKLYRDAQHWAINATLPLILPRFSCLQQPGTLLRTTIRNVLHVPRRYRDYRTGIYFNGQYLYAREQLWEAKDVIQVYDLKNFGEQIQTIKLNADLITMTILKSEKFLIAKMHSKSSRKKVNYHTKAGHNIFNLQTRDCVNLPVTLDDNVQKIILANLEDFFIVLHSKTEFTIFNIGAESNVIWLKKNIPFKSETDYEDGWLNLDDAVVVFVAKNGSLSAYNINDGSYMWSNTLLATADENEYVAFGTFKLHFTSTKKIICRGLLKSNWNKLFVICEHTGQLLTTCKGEKHPLDIILVHKSEEWVAAATSQPDCTDVDIGSDSPEKTKPLFFFDMENGQRLEQIKGNRGAFKSAIFLGDSHEYVAFSRQFDPSIIIIYIGTPHKPYLCGRQLLKLNGHTKAVTCFVKDPLNYTLITASDDNHIKVWDLQTILILCKMFVDNSNLQYSLEEDNSEQLKTNNSYQDAANRHILFSGNLAKNLKEKLMSGCHANVIAISSNHKHAATGCLFGRLVFFSLDNGDFIVTQGHSKQVNKLVFSTFDIGVPHLNEFLVSAAYESVIRFWNPVNGNCIKTIDTDMKVNDIALYNDYIYVGGSTKDDNEKKNNELSLLQKYHIVQGTKLMEYKRDEKFVFFDFVFVSSQNVVCSWNIRKIAVFEENVSPNPSLSERTFTTAESNLTFLDEKDKCGFIKATKNGRYVVCGSIRYLHIVNLASTIAEQGYIAMIDCGSNVNCLDFTEDCCFAVAGCYRKIHVVDLINGCLQRQMFLHSDYIENLILCSTGQHMITLSKDKRASLHEFSQKSLQSVKTLASFVFHCPVRYLAVPNDLTYILVGPESAAPLAVLTFNDFLFKKLKQIISNSGERVEWTKLLVVDPVVQLDQPVAQEDKVNTKYVPQVDIIFNEDYADVYIGENKSLSISVQGVETCKSIVNPFSSSSKNSGSNAGSCCIS